MNSNQLIKRNHISISGNGDKTILFSHGFGCDQHMWRFIAPSFEKNFKVVLFDHVGSGKSDLNAYDYDKYASLQGYADDIIEICTTLKFSNVIFVGHSVSSMIGVLAEKKHPHLFEKLILVGPSAKYINEGEYVGGFRESDIKELLESMDNNYLGWSSFISPVIMDNPEKPELAHELNDSICSTDPTIAKQFAKVTFLGDNRADLSAVSIPTLVIQSSVDAIAPVEVGKYVADHIPNASFLQIETFGHCPHLSHPKETFEAIATYINS